MKALRRRGKAQASVRKRAVVLLRTFPSDGRGAEERQRRASRPRSPTGIHTTCRTEPAPAQAISRLAARGSHLDHRGKGRASEGESAPPSGEGASIGQETRRRSTPMVEVPRSDSDEPRDPARRSVSTPPVQPNQHRHKQSRGSPHAARTSTTGKERSSIGGGSAPPSGGGVTIGQETRRRSTLDLSIRWSRCRGAPAKSLETPLADQYPHHPTNRTSTGTSSLEAHRTRLAPRPPEGRSEHRVVEGPNIRCRKRSTTEHVERSGRAIRPRRRASCAARR